MTIDKKILVLKSDGTIIELPKKPNLEEMQSIVGGYIEHVRVLDRIENGSGIYTSMYVNEDGLSLGLPRNELSTEVYQRNVKMAFPNAENPFLEASKAMRERFSGMNMTYINAMPEGYDADPYCVGDAILFQGYTVEEADA